MVITADQGLRGGKKVALKSNADKACEDTPSVRKMVVVKHGAEPTGWVDGRDVWYHELVEAGSELPRRGDGRGRSVVHFVHFRVDGKAERRPAHHRRLYSIRRHDAQICVRLPRWRHLLVYC